MSNELTVLIMRQLLAFTADPTFQLVLQERKEEEGEKN